MGPPLLELLELESLLLRTKTQATLVNEKLEEMRRKVDRQMSERSEAVTAVRSSKAFLGRGFRDIEMLLEAGFRELEDQRFSLAEDCSKHGLDLLVIPVGVKGKGFVTFRADLPRRAGSFVCHGEETVARVKFPPCFHPHCFYTTQELSPAGIAGEYTAFAMSMVLVYQASHGGQGRGTDLRSQMLCVPLVERR